MLDLLPTELVTVVILEAAFTDRASAVALGCTARFVYHIVRPILLRRIYITSSNSAKINDLLVEVGVGAFVLDLTITFSAWKPVSEVIACLTNLHCLRGQTGAIVKTISLLPPTGRESLRGLQLWDETSLSDVPPRVTHVCLYAANLPREGRLGSLVNWLRKVPSITHIGIEFVLPKDQTIQDFNDRLKPEILAEELEQLLEIGASRLHVIAIRICGHLSDLTTHDDWASFVEILKSWCQGSAMAAIQADRRVAVWHDERELDDWQADVQASVDDAMKGVDIWSAARALADW